jgi:uncharacterized phage protein gp47/JayE
MFNRPALLDLINRTRDDLLSRLTDSSDSLRRSDALVYARVLAAAAHELYGYLDWIAKQIPYDTADEDLLIRWASIWGIQRKAATKASGTVTFTGSDGAVIPAGAIVQAFDAVQYTVSTEVTVASGTAIAAIQAVDAGIAGNRNTGQTLTLTAPVSGVAATAIAGALTGGADIETVEALRARLIARVRQQPQGGAAHDYVAWALEVVGVTRAWVSALEMGYGTVTVRFMMDNTYADGIPHSGDVATVQAYLNLKRPVTAAVYAVAPIADTLDFTITGLTPSTTAIKAAIEAALAELIKTEGEPAGTLLWSAISSATGETDHTLTLPAVNVTSAPGHIPVMGTVTWA